MEEPSVPGRYRFINTKMLLFHIELVLPVSFQMLPALGTLLFRGHYQTGARPSQTALRHAIGKGVVCVWLTKQVSDGPPSRAVFKYGPRATAVMSSHVHTVRMYMFRSVLGQIHLSVCFRLFLGCWVRNEFSYIYIYYIIITMQQDLWASIILIVVFIQVNKMNVHGARFWQRELTSASS